MPTFHTIPKIAACLETMLFVYKQEEYIVISIDEWALYIDWWRKSLKQEQEILYPLIARSSVYGGGAYTRKNQLPTFKSLDFISLHAY